MRTRPLIKMDFYVLNWLLFVYGPVFRLLLFMVCIPLVSWPFNRGQKIRHVPSRKSLSSKNQYKEMALYCIRGKRGGDKDKRKHYTVESVKVHIEVNSRVPKVFQKKCIMQCGCEEGETHHCVCVVGRQSGLAKEKRRSLKRAGDFQVGEGGGFSSKRP